MSEVTVFLENVHISNYLSLRDVKLPLKPLTVVVGPNASGKSNILRALSLLKKMIIHEELPSVEFIEDCFWAGEATRIGFRLQAQVQNTHTEYNLVLKAKSDNLVFDEEALVNNVKVISIRNGEGIVQDEDLENRTNYQSDKLALKSAGAYGNKPITKALTEFIKGWEFYDIRPDLIRGQLSRFSFVIEEGFITSKSKGLRDSPKLDDDGSTLSELLSYWYENNRDRFDKVSESLAACTNIRIDQRTIDENDQLFLLEGHGNPIPFKRASEGTLRLVAYYILLNEPELPPLIAIEEPERNLHPDAIMAVADFLERLAIGSQVIITTHSSQLLDTFDPENLPDSLEVLLLRNPQGRGTEVTNLEDIRGNRPALDGWITDFGMGSAIFHSALLPKSMEESG